MKLKFTKMHGAGNDFVVIDAIGQAVALTPEQIRLVADRHFGVGCDQVLLVERPYRDDADFRYRIYNADGGEVEQCGNGARCFVRFVHHHGLTQQREIRVETAAGIIIPRLEEDGRVTVNMGVPSFEPKEVPFETNDMAAEYELDIDGRTIRISVLSMGNPHAIQIVDNIDTAPVAEYGPLIENHTRFPHRVNAGFMQIMDNRHIRLRVYERGSGETLSCGTGACAAVVAGIQRGLLQSRVDVATRGGLLSVAWEGEEHPVMLTGPTAIVFEAEIILK